MGSVHPAVPEIRPAPSPDELSRRYREVRDRTVALCSPLEPEDFVVQSMPDASPAKWHFGHTSWFFETFLLTKSVAGYRPYRTDFAFLFNSYYNALGDRIARGNRGLLSRPTIAEIRGYREAVDARMHELLAGASAGLLEELAPLVILGLNHEQQHQELILTDIKHAFASNPTRPVYRGRGEERPAPPPPVRWIDHPEGLRRVGHDGDGFAFDNEGPAHPEFVGPFRIASRLATNGEYLEFLADGGYDRPELWLSDGWDARRVQGWTAPLYWEKRDGAWWSMTLAGMRPIDPAEPVCHVSHYEADAYARWADARLPTEAEWETAAAGRSISGNLLEAERFHPAVALAGSTTDPAQLYGDVWEWTGSPYIPYPGYRPARGALGEYNGKFMSNKMVLRGGSCATPRTHIRATYRNFFPPDTRWQFSGIRLANDATA